MSERSIFPLRFKDVIFQPGNKHHALIKSFDFTLEAPGTLAVIGPNGAGKSLFLRLAHGLLQPTSGQIRWALPLAQAKRRQAMVFQRPVMLRRSVLANLEFALAQTTIPKNQHRDLALDTLSRLRIKRLAHQPARMLSFGEQQKLAVGRAWLLNPEVLFMDESTASLDPAATHELEALIQEIRANGTQVILVTHDLDQARRLADQVMFINRGNLVETGAAKIFFQQPETELADRFINGELLWWTRQKPSP